MTKREFFVAVSEGKMTEEMQAMAAEFLVKMDAQLAARKGKVSEKEQAKRDERETLARKVATEILGAEAKTATDVAAALTELLNEYDEEGRLIEVKVQKASSLCRKAVELGLAVQTDVKIPKKGSQKAYTAVVDMGDSE
jgi:glucuronate isomerase